MAWVLDNALVTFTFDVDGTTGGKLVSFLRAGGHTWTNAETQPWRAKCYDVTSAPSVTTTTITPTAATFSTAGVTVDGLGKQLILTWTSVPVGTDALTVVLTLRVNTGEDWLRARISASWVGTPTKYAVDQIATLPLQLDPFNNPNDFAVMPANFGILSENPILNLRFANGVPGFPNTTFGLSTSNVWTYPVGRGWTMGVWGYYETTTKEGWMYYVEDWSLEYFYMRFESDATRMVVEAFQPQPDNVIVKNNSLALGSGYTFCLRPFLASSIYGWVDIGKHYRSRMEANPPEFFVDVRPKRTDLSDAEKAYAPFIDINLNDSTFSLGDGKYDEIPALLDSARTNSGAPDGTKLNIILEANGKNPHYPSEPKNSDIGDVVKAVYDAGTGYVQLWRPATQANYGHLFPLEFFGLNTPSDARIKHWHTYTDIMGVVRMSRRGYIEGGGVDRLFENNTSKYYRERTYSVTGWNPATKTATVTGGSPSADGFLSPVNALLSLPSGSARDAQAAVLALGASTIQLSANFVNSLGVEVTPILASTITVFFVDDAEVAFQCHHAIVNSDYFFDLLKLNNTRAAYFAFGCCGFYQDTFSDNIIQSQLSGRTACYRDHSTWSNINPGYVRHPYGGGDWYKRALRDYVAGLRDAAKYDQIAAGMDELFFMSCEDIDETMHDVFDWGWHVVSSGKLWRSTDTFSPTIHKYKTIPLYAVVHAGRTMGRALNQEFASYTLIAAPPYNDVDLLRHLAYGLASEWPYGLTYATLSFYLDDSTPLKDFFDDTLYVSGGGSVSDEVKQVRDLWVQIVTAEATWILKYLRYGRMQSPAVIDYGATDTTVGLAQATWANYFHSYDTIYERATFPRVTHACWKADDGKVCVVLANWTQTAGAWAGTLDLVGMGLPAAGTPDASRIIVRRRDYTGAVSGTVTFTPSTGKLTIASVPAYSIMAVTLTAAGSAVVRLFTVDTMPTDADGLRGVIFQSDTGENGEIEYRRILHNDGQYVYLDSALTTRPSALNTWKIGAIASEWRSGLWDLGEPSEQKIVGYAELNLGPGGQGEVTSEIRFNEETVGDANNTYPVDSTKDRFRIGPKVGRGVRIQARLYDDAAENYWEVTDIEIGFMPRRAVKWPS